MEEGAWAHSTAQKISSFRHVTCLNPLQPIPRNLRTIPIKTKHFVVCTHFTSHHHLACGTITIVELLILVTRHTLLTGVKSCLTKEREQPSPSPSQKHTPRAARGMGIDAP